MNDLKVLSFLQRLLVLNNLFTTCPESGQVQYGERGVHLELLSCFHTSAQSALDTPLLSLRFADSGGEAAIHHPIVMTGHFIPPYRIPISGTLS